MRIAPILRDFLAPARAFEPCELAGVIRGVAVTVRFLVETYGSITLRPVEIEVPYAHGEPKVRFAIFPGQAVTASEIREGLMRDLEFGDPAFDAEYVVNAAPADVVRELLDGPTRASLLESRLAIRTSPKALIIRHDSWIDDAAKLESAVEFALSFAARIGPAAESASANARAAALTEPYRDHKTDDEIALERTLDVAAVKAIDERRLAVSKLRSARWQVFFWLLVFAIVGGILLLVVVFGRRDTGGYE